MSKQQTVDPIAEIEGQIKELQSQQAEGARRVQSDTETVDGLLSRRNAPGIQRASLVAAYDQAQSRLRAEQADLERNKGRATEKLYASRLASAEASVADAASALTVFDAANNPMAIEARIQALQSSIRTEEQQLERIDQHIAQLREQLQGARQRLGKVAYEKILNAYSNLLTVIDAEGPALAGLRFEQQQWFNVLLQDMEMTADQWFDLLHGASNGTEMYRPLLTMRRKVIQERLKKL
jgi:molecular chaperone GrpE (heat shock protein)